MMVDTRGKGGTPVSEDDGLECGRGWDSPSLLFSSARSLQQCRS